MPSLQRISTFGLFWLGLMVVFGLALAAFAFLTGRGR